MSRLFHSMILLNSTLFISGGLTYHNSHTPTPSQSTLIIPLTCPSPHTITSPAHWGHSIVLIDQSNALVSGGFSNDKVVDSILMISLACQSITDSNTCTLLPHCVSCHNATDFIRCYHSNESELCNEDVQVHNSSKCEGREGVCGQFMNCLECLSFDVAMAMGCVWNVIDARCYDNDTILPADIVARSYDDQRSLCSIDICGYASCYDCISDSNCGWTFIQIFSNLQQTSISTGDDIEWGCYANKVNTLVSEHLSSSVTIETCPSPCNLATSCYECVQSNSSGGGRQYCVWEVFTEMCIQLDLSPLHCSEGLCSEFVTNSNECPLLCSEYYDCDGCQGNPLCGWYATNSTGFCTDAYNSALALQSHWSIELDSDWLPVLNYGAKCPECTFPNCSGHGICVTTNVTCACYRGYVGEGCEVECDCGGLSYCANTSQSGRRICLDCQENTQVCEPFLKVFLKIKYFCLFLILVPDNFIYSK